MTRTGEESAGPEARRRVGSLSRQAETTDSDSRNSRQIKILRRYSGKRLPRVSGLRRRELVPVRATGKGAEFRSPTALLAAAMEAFLSPIRRPVHRPGRRPASPRRSRTPHAVSCLRWLSFTAGVTLNKNSMMDRFRPDPAVAVLVGTVVRLFQRDLHRLGRHQRRKSL